MHRRFNSVPLMGPWGLGLILFLIGSGAFAMSEDSYYLAPCPASPNCVCSDEPETSPRYIAPIVSARADGKVGGQDDARLLLAGIATYLSQQPGYDVTHLTEDQLRAEGTTRLLRFVDDLEFRVRSGSVLVRSASRVGFSDLGKNRRRLEALRRAMIDQGFALPRSAPL